MAYTWAQFSTYLRLTQVRMASRTLTDLVVQSNAFNGGDGAKKLVRDLQRQAEG